MCKVPGSALQLRRESMLLVSPARVRFSCCLPHFSLYLSPSCPFLHPCSGRFLFVSSLHLVASYVQQSYAPLQHVRCSLLAACLFFYWSRVVCILSPFEISFRSLLFSFLVVTLSRSAYLLWFRTGCSCVLFCAPCSDCDK